ncbi:atherin-like [Panicum virgatum]|uniref:atherin-like n=1 Tax=Panicum virgatum TaxID=38727 RepID=UPI0019D5E770|nr:atherin-like [Panicum virgatum]
MRRIRLVRRALVRGRWLVLSLQVVAVGCCSLYECTSDVRFQSRPRPPSTSPPPSQNRLDALHPPRPRPRRNAAAAVPPPLIDATPARRLRRSQPHAAAAAAAAAAALRRAGCGLRRPPSSQEAAPRPLPQKSQRRAPPPRAANDGGGHGGLGSTTQSPLLTLAPLSPNPRAQAPPGSPAPHAPPVSVGASKVDGAGNCRVPSSPHSAASAHQASGPLRPPQRSAARPCLASCCCAQGSLLPTLPNLVTNMSGS